MSQLVFIDESGDPGFKQNSSSSFAFALIIFEQQDWANETELTMQEIAVEAKHLAEFKYSKTCKKVKDIFFNGIKNCNFRAKVLYVDKAKIQSFELKSNSNKFYNYFLKQVLTHAKLESASIKLDGKKDAVKQELISYIRTQAKDVVKKIKYEDSKNNRLIQLADMIVGLVSHAYSNTATDEQKHWLKLLSHKLDIWSFK